MARDYIVDEVRRTREQQAAKHRFDISAILAAAKRRQGRSTRTVVSLIQEKAIVTVRPRGSPEHRTGPIHS